MEIWGRRKGTFSPKARKMAMTHTNYLDGGKGDPEKQENLETIEWIKCKTIFYCGQIFLQFRPLFQPEIRNKRPNINRYLSDEGPGVNFTLSHR